MKKSNIQSSKRTYQIIVAALASAFTINLVWSIWNAWKMYDISQPKAEIHQISLVLALILAVLPIVLFGISYAVIKGDRWTRLYRASLLTFGAMLIVLAVKNLFYLSGFFLVVVDTGSWWPVKFELIPLAVGLVPFVVATLKIKRQNAKNAQQLEKYVLVGGATAFLTANIVQNIYAATSQELFTGTHLFMLLVMLGVNVLLFLPVYLQEKKRPRFERAFRAMLVAATVMYFWLSVSQLTVPINFTQLNALLMATVYTALIVLVFVSYIFVRRQVRTLPW